LVDAKTIGISSHKKSPMGSSRTHLEDWRPTVAHAGHIVVPPLPV